MTAALSPERLSIHDDSAAHRGHAGDVDVLVVAAFQVIFLFFGGFPWFFQGFPTVFLEFPWLSWGFRAAFQVILVIVIAYFGPSSLLRHSLGDGVSFLLSLRCLSKSKMGKGVTVFAFLWCFMIVFVVLLDFVFPLACFAYILDLRVWFIIYHTDCLVCLKYPLEFLC